MHEQLEHREIDEDAADNLDDDDTALPAESTLLLREWEPDVRMTPPEAEGWAAVREEGDTESVEDEEAMTDDDSAEDTQAEARRAAGNMEGAANTDPRAATSQG